MQSRMRNLVVAASAGAAAGAVLVHCAHLASAASKEDEEDAELDRLLENAFSVEGRQAGAASSPPPASSAAQKDAVDIVIAEEEAKRQAELLEAMLEGDFPASSSATSSSSSSTSAPSSASLSAQAPLPTSGTDRVKGVVKTNPDGSRVFKKPDLGLEFTIPRGFYGLDEYVQPQPSGDSIWVGRFGDPSNATPASTQLVFVAEQVGPGVTIEEYAEKSRKACQESMGGFSSVSFDQDCAVSGFGPFQRRLDYDQVIPAVPGGPPQQLDLHLSNYMMVCNGVAYTLQLMGEKSTYSSSLPLLDEAARNVSVGNTTRVTGILSVTSEGPGGSRVAVEVPGDMSRAPSKPGAELLACFAFGGDTKDSFTPTNGDGAPITIIADDPSSAEAEASLSDLLKKESRPYQIYNDGGAGFLEYVVSCPNSSEDAVYCCMVRCPPGVRVAAWCILPGKAGEVATAADGPPGVPQDQRVVMQTQALAFGARVSQKDSAKLGSAYRYPAKGFSFELSPEGALKEQRFGDTCVVYRDNREMPHPELQVMQTERKPSLQSFKTELMADLMQSGAQVSEQSEGWMGREQVIQLTLRVPMPPMSEAEMHHGPVISTVFITLINTDHAAYMLQWQCPSDRFDSLKPKMEAVLATFRFFELAS